MGVEITGVEETEAGVVRQATQLLEERLGAISELPAWVVSVVTQLGQDVNGAQLPTPKDGGAPLQGKGDLLSLSRFDMGAIEKSENGLSRTLTYSGPHYYQYLIQKGYAFILDGQLNPAVLTQVYEAMGAE